MQGLSSEVTIVQENRRQEMKFIRLRERVYDLSAAEKVSGQPARRRGKDDAAD